MSQGEKDAALLFGLVMMFQTAAMQHMGKLKNPATDKIERDLDQAQFAIDTLDMLMAKTKGNLSDEEERFMKTVVKELKLNFVDEMGKAEKSTESKEPT